MLSPNSVLHGYTCISPGKKKMMTMKTTKYMVSPTSVLYGHAYSFTEQKKTTNNNDDENNKI